MDGRTDLSFDIDALFDHMSNNLNHALDDAKDWNFTLRSHDLSALQEVAQELQSEFIVQLQETVEEIGLDGQVSVGKPMLSVSQQAALSVEQVKSVASLLETIALNRGFQYEGVECYEPVDGDEVFGWLEPDDASRRLQHMTDCGLEDNAPLPWAFLIVTKTGESAAKLWDSLADSEFEDRDDYGEPDEEGNYGSCVFVDGRNNESEMLAMLESINTIAESVGGSLSGVQFYSREDLAEFFDTEYVNDEFGDDLNLIAEEDSIEDEYL